MRSVLFWCFRNIISRMKLWRHKFCKKFCIYLQVNKHMLSLCLVTLLLQNSSAGINQHYPNADFYVLNNLVHQNLSYIFTNILMCCLFKIAFAFQKKRQTNGWWPTTYLNRHLKLLSNPVTIVPKQLWPDQPQIYELQSNRNTANRSTFIYHACFTKTGGFFCTVRNRDTGYLLFTKNMSKNHPNFKIRCRVARFDLI